MKPPPAAFLSLVLHCHLPFVRHPEQEYFLEENWYFEALFETYLPLLARFEEMEKRGIPFKATLSISPTLLSMWKDSLLSHRALRYQEDLVSLLDREKKRLEGNHAFGPVLEMYGSKLREYGGKFRKDYGLDLSRGFRRLQDLGRVELMTCAATHGYLPLLGSGDAVRAQVRTAVDFHEACFGEKPRGFWLPECGYQPGLEEILSESGIRYFLVDTHGLLHATPRPRYGSFAPASCPNGTAVFARDMESSKQVWSSKEGYPGDPQYRDFYRDIGFDLAWGDLQPFVRPEGIRRFTGLKYFRVTGPGDLKEPYDPGLALQKAREHAGHFLDQRLAQAEKVRAWMDRPPQFVCMYDAELFGHWWFEGPDFLFSLFEANQGRGNPVEFLALSEYLGLYPDLQKLQPAASSWGVGGYSEFWLNDQNDWVYPLLGKACARMAASARTHPAARGLERRALDQSARELLLAQASDWAFMMKTGNHRAYAEARVRGHLAAFDGLQDQLETGTIDEIFLGELERRDNLFPGLDYRVYGDSEE